MGQLFIKANIRMGKSMGKVDKKNMTTDMRETFLRTKCQASEPMKSKKSVSRICVSLRCLQAR